VRTATDGAVGADAIYVLFTSAYILVACRERFKTDSNLRQRRELKLFLEDGIHGRSTGNRCVWGGPKEIETRNNRVGKSAADESSGTATTLIAC
jgi:hypothetical protein